MFPVLFHKADILLSVSVFLFFCEPVLLFYLPVRAPDFGSFLFLIPVSSGLLCVLLRFRTVPAHKSGAGFPAFLLHKLPEYSAQVLLYTLNYTALPGSCITRSDSPVFLFCHSSHVSFLPDLRFCAALLLPVLRSSEHFQPEYPAVLYFREDIVQRTL